MSWSFTGTADYFGTLSPPDYNSVYSVGCWFRVDGLPGDYQVIWCNTNGNVIDYDFLGVDSAGKLTLGIGANGSTDFQTLTSVDDGLWHYVLFSRTDSATVSLYLDGVALLDSASLLDTSGRPATAVFSIGAFYFSSAFWGYDGQIDCLAIWNSDTFDGFSGDAVSAISKSRNPILSSPTRPQTWLDPSGSDFRFVDRGPSARSWLELFSVPFSENSPSIGYGSSTAGVVRIPDRVGYSATSLAPATTSGAGSLTFTGTSATSLAPVTTSGAGSLTFTGTSATSLAPVTTDAVGVQGYTGTSDTSLSAVITDAAGLLTFSGTSATSLAPATTDAVGQTPHVGTSDTVLFAITTSASGDVTLSGIFGEIVTALRPIETLGSSQLLFIGQSNPGTEELPQRFVPLFTTGTGQVDGPRLGTIEQALGFIKGSGVGTQTFSGTAQSSLAAIQTSGIGAPEDFGTSATSLVPIQTAGSASLTFSGSSATSVPAVASAAPGQLLIIGVGSTALPSPFVASATGQNATTGLIEVSLLPVQVASSGHLNTTGQAATNLLPIVQVAVGQLTITGAGSSTLPAVVSAAAGLVFLDAQGGATLPILLTSGLGEIHFRGFSDQEFPGILSAGVGGQAFSGTGSASLGSIFSASVGALEFRGVGATSLAVVRTYGDDLTPIGSATAHAGSYSIRKGHAGSLALRASHSASIDLRTEHGASIDVLHALPASLLIRTGHSGST